MSLEIQLSLSLTIIHEIITVSICTAGLCIWSRWFVYVHLLSIKNRLFSALPLENLLQNVCILLLSC